MVNGLDPRAKPPEAIREVYKKYQKTKPAALTQDENVVNISIDLSAHQRERLRVVRRYDRDRLVKILSTFDEKETSSYTPSKVTIYEHEDCQGTL
jgi:alkylated DNA repair protein alkB homolog 1